jgi:hypothetical protein
VYNLEPIVQGEAGHPERIVVLERECRGCDPRGYDTRSGKRLLLKLHVQDLALQAPAAPQHGLDADTDHKPPRRVGERETIVERNAAGGARELIPRGVDIRIAAAFLGFGLR